MCPKSPTVAGFDVLEALKNMEVGGESAVHGNKYEKYCDVVRAQGFEPWTY